MRPQLHDTTCIPHYQTAVPDQGSEAPWRSPSALLTGKLMKLSPLLEFHRIRQGRFHSVYRESKLFVAADFLTLDQTCRYDFVI